MNHTCDSTRIIHILYTTFHQNLLQYSNDIYVNVALYIKKVIQNGKTYHSVHKSSPLNSILN